MLTRKMVYFGTVPLFLMASGLGMFLEYQRYATWAFVLIYFGIFGTPFMWALPLRDLKNFDLERAFFHGLTAMVVFGLFHAIHLFVGGSNGSFLFVVPIVVMVTASFSTSLFKTNEKGI